MDGEREDFGMGAGNGMIFELGRILRMSLDSQEGFWNREKEDFRVRDDFSKEFKELGRILVCGWGKGGFWDGGGARDDFRVRKDFKN